MPQEMGTAPTQRNPASRKSTPTNRNSVSSKPKTGRDGSKNASQSDNSERTNALPSLEPSTARALLDTLYYSFKHVFNSTDYVATLRQIKRFFAEREYGKIFGPGEEERQRLAVYAADYAGGRAIGYNSLWSNEQGVRETLEGAVEKTMKMKDTVNSSETGPLRIACLGAGTGAEAVAVAGLLAQILKARAKEVETELPAGLEKEAADLANLKLNENADILPSTTPVPKPPIVVTCIDYADYSLVFEPVAKAISRSFPELADLASFCFEKLDLVSEADAPTLDSMFKDCVLITLNFTLNEILAQSKQGTVAFLQRLTSNCPQSCVLATIDSAGSFSDLPVGSQDSGQNKVYPAPMLLSLLSRGPFWEELASKDSVWWRLSKEDREESDSWYPARVEDFRCFVRVLRKR